MRVEIAIVAGGASSRMGRDKGSIVWSGATVLERIAGEALLVAPSVTVVGLNTPASWPRPSVRFVEDDEPGLGPLGGLRTALRYSKADAVLALANDTPLLTAKSIRWLLDLADAGSGETDGIAVTNHGQWEPLFSIYSRRCLPQIDLMLSSGSRALFRLLEKGSFMVVDAPEDVARELANFNTPEDWERLVKSSGDSL